MSSVALLSLSPFAPRGAPHPCSRKPSYLLHTWPPQLNAGRPVQQPLQALSLDEEVGAWGGPFVNEKGIVVRQQLQHSVSNPLVCSNSAGRGVTPDQKSTVWDFICAGQHKQYHPI